MTIVRILSQKNSMKSVSTKKNGSGFKSIIFVVAIIAMILILLFTCAKKGLISLPGMSSDEDVMPANAMQVAYIDVAASSGTEVDTIVKYKTVDSTNENSIVADDVVTQGENLDGYVLKIDLFANTPLTWSMLCPVDTAEDYNATTRDIEVAYVALQSSLEIGDYVDVRIKTNNNTNNFSLTDEIVLAKKEVIALNGTTITLRLNEDEQIMLTAAATDMAIVNSSNDDNKPVATIYTTAYVSHAQPAASVTYNNEAIISLLRNNPNLINNPTATYEKLMQETYGVSVN